MIDLKLDKDREIKSVVLYTDGGAKPNPGAAGFGIYGEVTYKGKQDQNFSFTYAHPIEKDTSNNVAELRGIKKAIEICLDHGIPEATIYCDNQYAISGYSRLPDWKKNGYYNRDGSGIKNLGEWQDFAKTHTKVEEYKFKPTIKWVKGHNDNPGNERADDLATQARILAKKGDYDDKEFKILDLAAPEKLPKMKYNRMLMCDDWYFALSEKDMPTNKDGMIAYFGGKSPDDDAVCKPDSEAYFSLTYLKETIPVLDIVYNEQHRINVNDDPYWVTGRLRSILTATGGAVLLRDGAKYAEPTGLAPSHRKERDKKGYSRGRANWRIKEDLLDNKGNELTYIANPPRNSFALWDYRTQLASLLDGYLDGTLGEHCYITDISDLIYDEIITMTKAKVPKEKVTLKVRPEISPPNNSLNVLVAFNGEEYKIPMLIGQEIPNRNGFSGLLTMKKGKPKVSILAVANGGASFRYHCIVELDGETTIWSAEWANLYVIGTDNYARFMERYGSEIKASSRKKKGKKKKK